MTVPLLRHAATRRATRVAVPALLAVLVVSSGSAGDLDTQLWGNLTFGWIRGDTLYYELDVEPKVLVSGDPKWRNVDVTPLVEYYPNAWIDLTGEMTVGSTVPEGVPSPRHDRSRF
jgi:hypothetical protein